MRPIVYHRIHEHEIDVSLKLQRVSDHIISNPSFDGLQVHGPFNYVMIVRCLRRADRIVENVSISMLGNLAEEHADKIVKPL